MGGPTNYFRSRWHRRVLTSALALAVGLGAAMIAYPAWSDYRLVRSLATTNAAARNAAIIKAVAAAGASPRTLSRLERSLDTPDDLQFMTIVLVLREAGRFDTPSRDPIHIDRMRALDIAGTQSAADPRGAAQTRRMILMDVISSGRDNRYTRQALATAGADIAGPVRACAAILAARLADDAALGTLLADKDAAVVSAAAVAAAQAHRSALLGRIEKLLAAYVNSATGDNAVGGPPAGTSQDDETVSSAAYALAIADGNRYGPLVAQALDKAQSAQPASAALRDRLLWVMTLMDRDAAAPAVGRALQAQRDAGRLPSAMTLLAAGRLRVAQAGADVKAVLAAAGRAEGEATELQALAALEAAGPLGAAARAEVNELCRRLWSTDRELLLISAARALGEQIALQQESPAGASPEECIQTLRQAASYQASPASQPDAAQPAILTTPVPSAAAAAALWKLQAQAAEPYVESIAASETTLPGDYLAWHIGRSGDARAFDLGAALMPPLERPPGVKPRPRVYNENERAAGAMLLALSARGDRQRQQAGDWIAARLAAITVGGRTPFYEGGSYRCALTILGCKEHMGELRDLLMAEEFPQRRVLTAMLAGGDRMALDWMLWNPRLGERDVVFLMINKGIGEVLTAAVPQLPCIEPAADEGIRLWQARLLVVAYGVGRDGLKVGL